MVKWSKAANGRGQAIVRIHFICGSPCSMERHVETVARELLARGWRPLEEKCHVASGDGVSPRLVDYEVWLAMRSLLAPRQPADGVVRQVAD